MNREENRETIIENIKNFFIKNSTFTIRKILKKIDDKNKVFEDLKEDFNNNKQYS